MHLSVVALCGALAYAATGVAALSLPTTFSSWKHLFHEQLSSLSSASSPSSLREQTPLTDNDARHQLKSTTRNVVSASTGKVHAWNVHTLEEFPGYSIRVKEEVELCDKDVKQYVGYLDVAGETDDKHFFFWFFESRRDPAKDPFVLWLNGGPGCSSLTGLFMELGPCRVNSGGNGTTLNPHAWNNEANIVFLDQPVNVGFSYTDDKQVTNTVDASTDVYAFLQLFLNKYTKYAKANFHVTGESYAGHYIPAIGAKIAQENAELQRSKPDTSKVVVHLTSLAIGNGLTDPLVQYEYYADMAEDTKYGPILDEEEIDGMRSKYPTCKNLIESCYKWSSSIVCVPGAIYCNNAMMQPFQKTGLNVYDIRKKCDPSNPLCYPILSDIEQYLNRPDVQDALGVDRQYEGCKQDINLKFMMAGDWMRPFMRTLPPLLESGIKILIYAGDADFICNWIGNKAWTLELDWAGSGGFQEAEDVSWKSEITGKKAGEIRTYGGLTFLRLYEAGHMVPYDQPEHAVEMINHWIRETKH